MHLVSLGPSDCNLIGVRQNPNHAMKIVVDKFSSASNFLSAPINFKFGEYVVLVSKSLDPGETPSYSASDRI